MPARRSSVSQERSLAESEGPTTLLRSFVGQDSLLQDGFPRSRLEVFLQFPCFPLRRQGNVCDEYQWPVRLRRMNTASIMFSHSSSQVLGKTDIEPIPEAALKDVDEP